MKSSTLEVGLLLPGAALAQSCHNNVVPAPWLTSAEVAAIDQRHHDERNKFERELEAMVSQAHGICLADNHQVLFTSSEVATRCSQIIARCREIANADPDFNIHYRIFGEIKGKLDACQKLGDEPCEDIITQEELRALSETAIDENIEANFFECRSKLVACGAAEFVGFRYRPCAM